MCDFNLFLYEKNKNKKNCKGTAAVIQIVGVFYKYLISLYIVQANTLEVALTLISTQYTKLLNRVEWCIYLIIIKKKKNWVCQLQKFRIVIKLIYFSLKKIATLKMYIKLNHNIVFWVAFHTNTQSYLLVCARWTHHDTNTSINAVNSWKTTKVYAVHTQIYVWAMYFYCVLISEASVFFL